ncbi:serine/threonine-protein kinase tricorner-like [Dorcoceras hygrometricum]|uniref:Serine/threonine-protein kinase tricorner-like n=1 Tax=Dorcoceras hygrometricum TaxID=472368 RepID=A0A2Z6ZRV7_9LAMI|nr:serine/threonine-protein kinase tricorner-like [Dorcoceras hygrometricum]
MAAASRAIVARGRPRITCRCAPLGAKEMRAGRASRPVNGRLLLRAVANAGRCDVGRRCARWAIVVRCLAHGCATGWRNHWPTPAYWTRNWLHGDARLCVALGATIAWLPHAKFVVAPPPAAAAPAKLRRCRDG